MSLLGVALAIFAIGLAGVLIRRDIVAILASVEVMLGGALLLFVGLSATLKSAQPARAQGMALVVLVVVAGEAAVGLALLVSIARARRTTRIDELTEVRG